MKKTVRMTIRDYATARGCSPQYVQQLIHKGVIKFERFGKQYVILESPKAKQA